MQGHCTCGAVRYQLTQAPLFVHCCHCHWCQRETGSAFALNALIETGSIEVLQGEPERVSVPSNSGAGQQIVRCPKCQVALWSFYGGAGDAMAFVKVGTLEDADAIAPDIHIYTESKQPWVTLPDDVPCMPQYYDAREHWPEASQARYRELVGENR